MEAGPLSAENAGIAENAPPATATIARSERRRLSAELIRDGRLLPFPAFSAIPAFSAFPSRV